MSLPVLHPNPMVGQVCGKYRFDGTGWMSRRTRFGTAALANVGTGPTDVASGADLSAHAGMLGHGLASARFLPAGDNIYSTTSATAVVINALCSITFTVPPSGSVLFMFHTHTRVTNVATNNTMCIRDAAGMIAGSALRMTPLASLNRFVYFARVSGLTPGAQLTWWPSFFSSDGVNGAEVRAGDGSSNHGPIQMEVGT
jgi:hypothetical protein